MSGLLAQFFENWIEQRILEFLRDNCAFQIEKTTGQTEPFKVAVVIARDDYAALRYSEKNFLLLDGGSTTDRPWSARNVEMIPGQFFVAQREKIDDQMRPRDYSVRRGTDADQGS